MTWVRTVHCRGRHGWLVLIFRLFLSLLTNRAYRATVTIKVWTKDVGWPHTIKLPTMGESPKLGFWSALGEKTCNPTVPHPFDWTIVRKMMNHTCKPETHKIVSAIDKAEKSLNLG